MLIDALNSVHKFSEEMLLQEELIEMLPQIGEANSISEELDKKCKFEAILVSPAARGEVKGGTKVTVVKFDNAICQSYIVAIFCLLQLHFVLCRS